ncbi:MAG: 4Fe-4S dicluster domain-containing protein [Thermoleophilia bacterium]|nr:4Fe-4S dicluster domain-containing protein [Thermoleophilia bacterium]
MIANYGYQDGSGEYYITIDTDRCIECEGRWCVGACPQSLFVIEADDYDDEVATIAEGARKKLKEKCAACKPAGGHESLPCIDACRPGAISHSW